MGLFALIKPLSFAASFFKTSQLHEFLSICAQKNIECSKQELLKFLCWSKKVLKSIAPSDSILEQIGYIYEMNRSLRFMHDFILSHDNIYFMPFCMYASKGGACHFDGIWYNKFYNFFFILIQSCKITIYIFHLGELED